MMRRRGLVLLAAGCTVALQAHAQAPVSYYAIGNSLTYDHRPDLFAAIPAQRQQMANPGWHIRVSSSLDYIVTHPADVTLAQPAPFESALPGTAWSNLLIEPYPGNPTEPSTIATDVAAFQRIVDLAGASSAARVYIYEAWPAQTSTNGLFADYWRQPVVDADTQLTILSRQYFDALLRRLRVALDPGRDVRVIPIGDVMAALDDQIRMGAYPEIASLNDIYRDPIHMGEVGQFIAAMTAYATLYGQDPSGLAIPPGYLGSGVARLTPALELKLQGLIWSVVRNDPRTRLVSLRADPSSVPFSSQATGSRSPAFTLTLSNDGMLDVPITSISATGDYAQDNDCPAVLASGANCLVRISFEPVAVGDRAGTLRIDAGVASSSVVLSGTAPVSVQVSASPASMSTGESTLLSWSASAGSQCQASGGASGDGWAGPLEVSGERSISESKAGVYQFGVQCSSGSQSATRQVAVTVSWPVVEASLSSSVGEANDGQSITLAWTSAHASDCSATGGSGVEGWSGSKAATGSQQVTVHNSTPAAADTTFDLLCSSSVSGLSARASVKVKVMPPPQTANGGGGGVDTNLLAGLLTMILVAQVRRQRFDD